MSDKSWKRDALRAQSNDDPTWSWKREALRAHFAQHRQDSEAQQRQDSELDEKARAAVIVVRGTVVGYGTGQIRIKPDARGEFAAALLKKGDRVVLTITPSNP
jgi:hypothetical protein